MAYYDNAYDKKSYLGGDEMSASFASEGGGAAASGGGGDAAASGAAGGMAAGGPAGAAIGVGGAFLTNYLAQKAADERAKRAQALQIQSEYAQNQNKGFDTMMKAYQGALR